MDTNRRTFLKAGTAACLALPSLPRPTAGAIAPGENSRPARARAAEGAALRYDFSWNRREHARRSSRQLPPQQSVFMDKPGPTPPAVNMEGEVSYYPQERVRAVRERIKGVDRRAYLQDILDRVLKGARTDRERVAAVCRFVGDAIYYNPIQCSFEQVDAGKNWKAISDPIELLELHDGRCGQGVVVTRALLDLAGIESRQVVAIHHTSCEARYDGGWHLADALMFGAGQPHRDGVVLSAEEIKREPYFVDSFPMPYLYCPLEEYFSEDGFRALGYVFGEWGSSSTPYQSYYWGAPLDTPPTLPYPLVTQRLDGKRVRLNWSPSFKAGGGEVEYRVVIFADRACTQRIQVANSRTHSLEWEVPEMNRLYYFEVTAMDDHRRHNPATWYLATRNNFLLVPREQYGWYGVV